MEPVHLWSERAVKAAESGFGLCAIHFGFSASGNWNDFDRAGARRDNCASGDASGELALEEAGEVDEVKEVKEIKKRVEIGL